MPSTFTATDGATLAYTDSGAAGENGRIVIVIDDARHATNLDQPNRFNEVLLEFLGRTA